MRLMKRDTEGGQRIWDYMIFNRDECRCPIMWDRGCRGCTGTKVPYLLHARPIRKPQNGPDEVMPPSHEWYDADPRGLWRLGIG